MTKIRRKTVALKRKAAAAKRLGGSSRPVKPIGWFYRAVNLPYRPAPEVEQEIEDAVNELFLQRNQPDAVV